MTLCDELEVIRNTPITQDLNQIAAVTAPSSICAARPQHQAETHDLSKRFMSACAKVKE